MGKRKTMKLRIFAVMMSLVMLSGILPPAEVLAAVLSPYTSVETTEEASPFIRTRMAVRRPLSKSVKKI